jgi:hypothetical protein
MSDNGGNDATGSSEFNAEPGTNEVTELETGDVTPLESSNLPEPVDAPVPLENSLENIPFNAKDLDYFNKNLRDPAQDYSTQLKKLYRDGSLRVVTFSVFDSSSTSPGYEEMVNELTIDPLEESNILTIKNIYKI